MDYLLEYMPVVGDMIRIGKYSYKLGEIISSYFAQQNETESDFTVVWRRTDVFMVEEKAISLSDIFIGLLSGIPLAIFLFGLMYAFWYIFPASDGLSLGPYMLIAGVLAFYVAMRIFIPMYNSYLRGKEIGESSEIEVTNSDIKLIRTSNGKMGIAFWKANNDCKVLLKPIYSDIEKGFNGSYIVRNAGKSMLYNSDLKMFVAEDYDYIVKYKEGVYLSVKGDNISLLSPKGDRVD